MKQFIETAEQITLHGLGFLQIKLPGKQRIHVWHPDLPRRKCFKHSSVHDHRFGFTATVLKGLQVNQFYRPVSTVGCEEQPILPWTHVAYLHEGERTRFGNRPWVEDYRLRLEKAGEKQYIMPGQSYSVSPYIFHATESDGVVVTLMTKTSEHKQGAHSLCEIGVQPDVDFDRKQWSEDRLWEIFVDAMKSE